jgi:glutathione S-transferase
LREIDVPYNYIHIDLIYQKQHEPEFLMINPYGKVPVLIDRDVKIFESAAICTYLAEKYPEKNMIPQSGTKEKAYFDQWMYFTMTELDAALWIIVKHTFIYPPEKMQEESRDLAAEDFRKAARILNHHLSNKKFVMGDEFTAVDVMLGQTLAWAYGYDVMLPFELLRDAPHLRAYLKQLSERPAMPESLRVRCEGL